MATIDSFQAARPRLMSLAQRMLGDPSDAEAVIQEAWLRWQALDARIVRDPSRWLVSSVSRLCHDRLREGPAAGIKPAPEPSLTAPPLDLASVSLGFMLVFERLGPIERSVYVLHQVFDYTPSKIGQVLKLSEPQVRETFQRAVEHLAANRERFAAPGERAQT
jgi:RNA polymerase sigma-70 factor (ECF subfamily)